MSVLFYFLYHVVGVVDEGGSLLGCRCKSWLHEAKTRLLFVIDWVHDSSAGIHCLAILALLALLAEGL